MMTKIILRLFFSFGILFPLNHCNSFVNCLNLRQQQPTINRRTVIVSIPTIILSTSNIPSAANAIPLFDQNNNNSNRRQLDLCLVNLLRVQYWAISLSNKMKNEIDNNNNNGDEERMKSAYLEARLGSKVIVAPKKKIGGGANANVFMLKGLQIKDCLDDLKYYAPSTDSKKKKMNQSKDDLIEALASIVEFDGLETTQDPSPRSELTLKMYNPQKGVFVQRMLSERVVSIIDDIFRLYGPDSKSRSIGFVQEYYPKEVPVGITTTPASEQPKVLVVEE